MIYAKFLSFRGDDRVLVVQLTDFYMESVRKLASDPGNFPLVKFHPEDDDNTRIHGLSLPVPWCNLLRGDPASLDTVRSILSQANPDYARCAEYDSLAWDFDYLEPTGFDTYQSFLNAVQLASGQAMDDSYDPRIVSCILEPMGVLAIGYNVQDGDGEVLTDGDAYVKVLPD